MYGAIVRITLSVGEHVVHGVEETGQLPSDADVVVVGGGIVGLSCAHFLEQLGRTPLVVEQGLVGRGSSFGNAGLIAPSHSIPLPAPGVVRQGLRWLTNPESPFFIRPRANAALARWLVRFACSSRRAPMLRGIPVLRDLNRLSTALYAELAQAAQTDLGYKPTGVLNVYAGEAVFAHGRWESELLAQHGVPSQVLTGEELVEAEPALRDGLAGAVLWPEDGYVDPAAFVAALERDLAGRGIRILSHTEALGIAADDRMATLRTTRGTVRCADIVVAAGAWSATLVRALGPQMHIQPAKGYSVTIGDAAIRLRRPLLLAEAKVAVTPLDGRLRLAGTLELAGLDQRIDVRRLDAVRRSAEPYLRERLDGGHETVWRGLRPLSADGLPMIGRLPAHPRVAVATGHGHVGVSMAPATGKLVAELLTGRPPSIDLEPLRPIR
jgi:D-amino-acid dehydrogenase